MPPKTFKPPQPTGRPSSGVRKSKSKPTSTRPSSKPKPPNANLKRSDNVSRVQLPSLSPDPSPVNSANDSASSPETSSPRYRNESVLEHEEGASELQREQGLPPALLTRILQEFFKEDSTRISSSAAKTVGRYMETFVREAIARAAFGRREAMGLDGLNGGWLEVEDLEKLAPQLILDF